MHTSTTLVLLIGAEHAALLAYDGDRLKQHLRLPLAPHMVEAATRALRTSLDRLVHDQVLVGVARSTPDELRSVLIDIVEFHGREREISVVKIPNPTELSQAMPRRPFSFFTRRGV